MKCPNCAGTLKEVPITVSGAESKAMSYQCTKCDYFAFEQKSSQQVLQELRESPLQIRQKIVKLSKDRLGLYLNSHIVKSLKMKSGEEVSITVPDKKHILIELC